MEKKNDHCEEGKFNKLKISKKATTKNVTNISLIQCYILWLNTVLCLFSKLLFLGFFSKTGKLTLFQKGLCSVKNSIQKALMIE